MIDPTKHRQLEELDTVNLCTQIFTNARNELYLNMHYLDLALSSFGFEADPTLSSVATDGFVIYYRPEWVFAMYKRGRVHINRSFLHMVFHCLFCHLDTRGKRAKDYWNLACDIAMESVIDGLYKKCVHVPPSPYRRELYLRLGKQMPVLTAEGIYDALQNMNLNERQYERMAEEFLVDDHSFWDLPGDSPKTPMVRQTQWSNNREKVQTEMETMGNQQDEENKSMLEQIQVENRERYDYRHFLQRFSVLREEMQVDPDSFDAIFYTYGLSLYGNMPLIEPLESRESKKIEELALVIDTSYSTSGELVRAFLAETYTLLKGRENFFHRMNLHLIQADNAVRQDILIRNEDELIHAMNHFELRGGGGTDFRPAFAYVDQLCAEKKFSNLRGLLYFTDGMGTYPARRPGYDTAFLFLGERFDDANVPPWAMKVVLDEEEFTGAAARPASALADALAEEDDLYRELNNS